MTRALVLALAVAGCSSQVGGEDASLPDATVHRPDLAGAPIFWDPPPQLPPTKENLWAIVTDPAGGGTTFIVGDKGTVLASPDGAMTLFPLASGTPRDLLGAWMVSTKEVLVVGRGGTILRTRDGGQSWLGETSNTLNDLHAVVATAGGEAWAFGDGGNVTHTLGGGTWNQLNSPVSADLLGAAMDGKKPIAVGRKGAVVTTDANGAIVQIMVPTTADLYAIHALPTAWVAGSGGTLLHGLQGGAVQSLGVDEAMTGLTMTNGSACAVEVAVGQHGRAAHKCGNEEWQLDATGDVRDFYGVAAVGASDVVMVGTGGAILRRTKW